MFLWGKGRALGSEEEVTVVEVADTEGEGEEVGVEGEITGVEEEVMFRDLGHAYRVVFQCVTL